MKGAVELIKVQSCRLDDLATRAVGAAGVVTGRWTGKVTVNTKAAGGEFRFIDTFVKRRGRW